MYKAFRLQLFNFLAMAFSVVFCDIKKIGMVSKVSCVEDHKPFFFSITCLRIYFLFSFHLGFKVMKINYPDRHFFISSGTVGVLVFSLLSSNVFFNAITAFALSVHFE